jgi:hypothetical protein
VPLAFPVSMFAKLRPLLFVTIDRTYRSGGNRGAFFHSECQKLRSIIGTPPPRLADCSRNDRVRDFACDPWRPARRPPAQPRSSIGNRVGTAGVVEDGALCQRIGHDDQVRLAVVRIAWAAMPMLYQAFDLRGPLVA